MADDTNPPDHDALREAICRRVKGMVGYEPVGFGDLLNIMVHPDMIEYSRQWIETHYDD